MIELENRNIVEAHLSKIKRLTKDPLDFKVENVIRRQNSVDLRLDFFGDALDRMNQREGLAIMN